MGFKNVTQVYGVHVRFKKTKNQRMENYTRKNTNKKNSDRAKVM